VSTLTPTFETASALVLPTGKHRGKTIADVGVTSDGLLYLDWLRRRNDTPASIEAAAATFLAHPTIADELRELLS
jgi:hypothetical protein